MTPRRWIAAAAAAIAALLLLGRGAAIAYAESRWFAALGADDLWSMRVRATLVLVGVSWLAGAALLFVNLLAVRRSVVSLVLPRRLGNLELAEEVPGRYLTAAAAALALVISGALTIPAEKWPSLVLAQYGVPFGEADPYFDADLGVFVYWLPFESILYRWTVIALLVTSATVVFLYALTPSLRWEKRRLVVSQYVRRHLGALGVLVLLVLAWGYRLDAYGALLHGHGPAGAFVALDRRVIVPSSLALSVIAALAAVVVLWAGWTGHLRVALTAVGGVLVLALVLRDIVPAIASRSGVGDGVEAERDDAATRVIYTRRAYGMDRIVHGSDSLLAPNLASLAADVPAWDPAAVVATIGARRGGPPPSSRPVWLADSGRLEQVVLIPPSDPGDATAPWLATAVDPRRADDHGGAVQTRPATDETTEWRLPAALVADGATGYTVIADPRGHLPAPTVEGGIQQIAFAWNERDLRFLARELPARGARIILRRDARERVAALAPFFTESTAAEPLIVRDSLYWVIELFSTSEFYPVSARIQTRDREASYQVHAATAIVSAATGATWILADSVLDPIARTWISRLPRSFARRADLPAGVAEHLPPDLTGGIGQAVALAAFGRKAESWAPRRIPTTELADHEVAASGGPPLIRLPDSRLAWTLPVVDQADRLRGVAVVTGGPTRATVWVPLDSGGPLWAGALERMQRAATAAVTPAATSTSAPQAGRLVAGFVRTVPLRDGPALVQPWYRWTPGSAPLLSAVTVLHRDSVMTGRSVALALGVPDSAGATEPASVDLRARVRSLYEAMRAAARTGDWAAFGRAFDALGALVGRSP